MYMSIVVDICNTLADVNGIIESYFGKSEKYPDKRIPIDFFEKNLWIFRDAKPIENSAAVLTTLAERLNEDILYLTARPICSARITEEWLTQNGYPKGKLVFCDAKSEYLQKQKLKVSMIIDDSPFEYVSYLSNGFYNVKLLAWKYNEDIPGRFSNWNELL